MGCRGTQGGAGPWGVAFPCFGSGFALCTGLPHACHCVSSEVGLAEPLLHTPPSGGPFLTTLGSVLPKGFRGSRQPIHVQIGGRFSNQ